MKQSKLRFKSLLRWLILGGTFFFLGKVLKDNWQQVTAIRVTAAGWACVTIAIGVTLLAHICAGWVWSQILQEFKQPIQRVWAIQAYLTTNIAKYLPGNIWHYYGRITAATQAGAAIGAASVSVLLEPLLMAAAALLFAVLCSQQIAATYGGWGLGLQWLVLAGILLAIHPQVLNPVIAQLGKLKQKSASAGRDRTPPFQLDHYPLVPLVGQLGFLLLRGTGFLLTFLAISPIGLDQLSLVLGTFSVAWLLGLVIPGAPGGLGVFEATEIALLDQVFSPGIILSIVALYRLVSVLAEAGGAGLAWLDQRRSPLLAPPLTQKK